MQRGYQRRRVGVAVGISQQNAVLLRKLTQSCQKFLLQLKRRSLSESRRMQSAKQQMFARIPAIERLGQFFP